ncbi:MAG: MarR family transcriptional regulator [Glaciihabitans sp.]|jgi:DNA-binding MarR family transcriptional regulator|nr:MarR family transcriptional regulator [Glaciihabitans sp.]MCU1533740.1 MarR family transcriptional regulator [Glaciihabitans sp.]
MEPAAAPRWLTADQQSAWRKLITLVELLPGILDTQLQRDAELTHYEYFTLAMLSEAPDQTLRMTDLATATNASLPRLSHVISRLEKRGFVDREPCAEDRRAINARLTDSGWQKVVATAPGHVAAVRDAVIDPLDAADLRDLDRILAKILARTNPRS